MLMMEATVFSEQFLISYTVTPVITYSLDKLVCNTYLSNNPERFIESNAENSWNECINTGLKTGGHMVASGELKLTRATKS